MNQLRWGSTPDWHTLKGTTLAHGQPVQILNELGQPTGFAICPEHMLAHAQQPATGADGAADTRMGQGQGAHEKAPVAAGTNTS